ncbi:MAG: bifunctional ornithine acetyltransferase/N-acetylglutamate synthase, partial [Verrucomicrobia bacterium]|nr:bifunctional ornithine acetyltransferase/N-acetylglutamate synthase [Verrucomicrobiota bacterium]
MEPLFKILPNEGVTAPAGFRAGGVFCDIKRLGTGKGSSKGQKRDLAVLYSAVDASVAGMFTTNQVCAAPVKVSESRVPGGVARAVVANSGNANACTGEQGIRDARRMTELTAELLGIEAEKVLVCSTGRIGVQMPMENVERGIRMALETASDTAESAHFAAEAIMTSDNVSKETAVELVLGGKT